ncbi:MAG: hypothetical protein RLZZ39_981 [Actinomycetota bacterium]
MGFGRAPSTRAPTPIPTAVATMVTIQEATISTYSSARSMTWRTRKSRANTVDLSVHNRFQCAQPHPEPHPPPERGAGAEGAGTPAPTDANTDRSRTAFG